MCSHPYEPLSHQSLIIHVRDMSVSVCVVHVDVSCEPWSDTWQTCGCCCTSSKWSSSCFDLHPVDAVHSQLLHTSVHHFGSRDFLVSISAGFLAESSLWIYKSCLVQLLGSRDIALFAHVLCHLPVHGGTRRRLQLWRRSTRGQTCFPETLETADDACDLGSTLAHRGQFRITLKLHAMTSWHVTSTPTTSTE